jgi:hypothetical protein
MAKADEEVLLVPLTKPAQPLENATAKAKTTEAAGHTSPFMMVFTFPTFFWAGDSSLAGGGMGHRENRCLVSPDLSLKGKKDMVPVLLARGPDLVQG